MEFPFLRFFILKGFWWLDSDNELPVSKKTRREENRSSDPVDVKNIGNEKEGRIATTAQVIGISLDCCYVLQNCQPTIVS